MTTTTTTTTATTRTRGLSIYFTVPHGPDRFSSLPAELALRILELALATHKRPLPALALISKRITALVDVLLYTAVTLATPKSIALFARTAASKPPAFLAAHVKKLAVTWTGPADDKLEAAIARIARACTGLRALAVPPCVPVFAARPFTPAPPAPFELVLGSFLDLRPAERVPAFYLPAGAAPPPPQARKPPVKTEHAWFGAVTHLRFCEPPPFYAAPSEALAALTPGAMPGLTHLQLARRARANEDNDRAFVEDVRALLAARPALRALVVSVFPSVNTVPKMEDVTRSFIWGLLREMSMQDGRLVVREGVYGEWTEGVEGDAFWRGVREQQRRMREVL
ncbi:hypothetical protein GLOTRDRAFT_138795 [Gloeophyllum trabeum ATCC 11539]|uniref:F-box domain-containing protein n=1 Tax=Gloeophyllum trabeum (strain ATCC 11539 / FP-39264 / Madison 617) TaxID=670483 RepID=S7RL86_GLOTA|nr:uncharacterized protein GLOTRDRAFT_138795 [Gloeophyllum trabeum ATCC 11539]EPQ55145.1 hypothetical protein GLOTRDRAFT_138795 [Gloeophyllum trabeum ATCC 11539]